MKKGPEVLIVDDDSAHRVMLEKTDWAAGAIASQRRTTGRLRLKKSAGGRLI